MRYVLIMILLVGTIVSSCEKVFFKSSQASSDSLENFNYLWEQCNQKYAFFADKSVDWDEVYRRYLPFVERSSNELELFNIFSAMLNELKDGHVNLISSFNVSHYNFSSTGNDNYNSNVVNRNYLSNNYYITGSFIHDFIYKNDIYGNEQILPIGYVRLDQFSGSLSNSHLDIILSRYHATKGLIIDIRENPGGSATNVLTFLKALIEKPTIIYYLQTKNGKGHEDFTPIEPVSINPRKDNFDVSKMKIVVLTDRGTFSAGSIFSLATKAIDNITLMGDATGGGLGLPNGGQLPNGWLYRISVSRTLDSEGVNYETNGVPPDILVDDDPTTTIQDEILDRAITEIINNSN